LDTLSQHTRLINLQMAVLMRPPYLARVQSSNAGRHILRSLEESVSGTATNGAFGNPESLIQVIVSSDYYVTGLAGLLDLHWLLPGYQPDFCAPGGALIFELRQVRATGQHIVRIFYTAQTFDQLRNLTPLTLDNPPATVQLLIPRTSSSTTSLDVDFATFQKLMNDLIDPTCVQPTSEETPPIVQNPYASSTPTKITASLSSNTFALAWPTDHRDWILQAQTNGLSSDLWQDLPGTANTNTTTVPVDPATPSVFYRLRKP
jgi:4-phytase/acid phosphatase